MVPLFLRKYFRFAVNGWTCFRKILLLLKSKYSSAMSLEGDTNGLLKTHKTVYLLAVV